MLDGLCYFESFALKRTKNLVLIVFLSGARAIFWDLRYMFLVQLYNGTVESTRLERLLPHIDSVNKTHLFP